MPSSGPSSPPCKRELQGPRPAPLRIDRSSFSISKSQQQQQQQPRLSSSSAASSSSSRQQQHSPVVVHVLSPKVVHTSPKDFMSTVQRLTGKGSPASLSLDRTPDDPGAIAPAPAAVEKAEPVRSPPVLYQFLI